jgi:hypothetical protein
MSQPAECARSSCGDLRCSKCARGVCAECSGCCDECGGVQCFECVDTCERCATFLCQKCVIDVKGEACPCCRMSEPSTLRLCTDCVLMMWMKPTKCDACIRMCIDDACKRNCVIKEQSTCPVCWDEITDNASTTVFQECELHRVCKTCASGMRLGTGCPLCRVGHFTP